MGKLINCSTCGKIFVQLTRNICPDCVEKEEQAFISVRDYIKKHPDSTVDEIVEATEVDDKKILRWMREGRLEYTGGIIPGLTCKRCGTELTLGEYCPKCVKSMISELNAAIPADDVKNDIQHKPKSPSSTRERMFVADRLRKE